MRRVEFENTFFLFVDRPVTYLYNTLHYYERKLQDRPPLKKRLVNAILNSFCESRSPGWSLSEKYMEYMRSAEENSTWNPELDHYMGLIQRLVDSILWLIVPSNFCFSFVWFPRCFCHSY